MYILCWTGNYFVRRRRQQQLPQSLQLFSLFFFSDKWSLEMSRSRRTRMKYNHNYYAICFRCVQHNRPGIPTYMIQQNVFVSNFKMKFCYSIVFFLFTKRIPNSIQYDDDCNKNMLTNYIILTAYVHSLIPLPSRNTVIEPFQHKRSGD